MHQPAFRRPKNLESFLSGQRGCGDMSRPNGGLLDGPAARAHGDCRPQRIAVQRARCPETNSWRDLHANRVGGPVASIGIEPEHAARTHAAGRIDFARAIRNRPAQIVNRFDQHRTRSTGPCRPGPPSRDGQSLQRVRRIATGRFVCSAGALAATLRRRVRHRRPGLATCHSKPLVLNPPRRPQSFQNADNSRVHP